MRILLFMMLCGVSLIGCGRTIHVVDRAGAPIKDAVVTAETPSFNNPPTATTDSSGNAELPTHINATYITVNKAGYNSYSGQIPNSFPLTVVLQSVPAP